MMVFLLIIHATHISSTLNLISWKHCSISTVMFLWTKQNPNSLAVKCHKWFCHSLKVQDSGSTTVHLHYIFSWQIPVNYTKGISYDRAAHTHTHTRACSSLHNSWTLPVWTTTLQTTGSSTRSASYSFTVSVWSRQVAPYKTVSRSSIFFPTIFLILLFSILKVSWHGPTQICAEVGNCDWPRHTQTLARLRHVPTSARPWPLSSDSTNKFVDGEGEGCQRCSSQSYVDEELVLVCVDVLDVSAQDKAFCCSNLGNWQTLRYKHPMHSSCQPTMFVDCSSAFHTCQCFIFFLPLASDKSCFRTYP